MSHLTDTISSDDEEYLNFLADRIKRLKATILRVDALGLVSSTSVGQSKTFVNAKEIEKQLYRTMAELDAFKAKLNGHSYDPTMKNIVIKNGYDI